MKNLPSEGRVVSEGTSEQLFDEALEGIRAPREAAPRGKRLDVLNRRTLAEGVERAVANALSEHIQPLPSVLLTGILWDVRMAFDDMVTNRARTLRMVSSDEHIEELEEAGERLGKQRDLARAELESLREAAEGLRRTLADSSAAPREDADAEIEAESEELRARNAAELEDRVRALVDEAGADEGALELALRVARAEHEHARVAHEESVEQLRRRIAKLNGSLETMEESLYELMQRKDVDAGLASRFRSVQGLSKFDENYATKRRMIDGVFAFNRDEE